MLLEELGLRIQEDSRLIIEIIIVMKRFKNHLYVQLINGSNLNSRRL